MINIFLNIVLYLNTDIIFIITDKYALFKCFVEVFRKTKYFSLKYYSYYLNTIIQFYWLSDRNYLILYSQVTTELTIRTLLT